MESKTKTKILTTKSRDSLTSTIDPYCSKRSQNFIIMTACKNANGWPSRFESQKYFNLIVREQALSLLMLQDYLTQEQREEIDVLRIKARLKVEKWNEDLDQVQPSAKIQRRVSI